MRIGPRPGKARAGRPDLRRFAARGLLMVGRQGCLAASDLSLFMIFGGSIVISQATSSGCLGFHGITNRRVIQCCTDEESKASPVTSRRCPALALRIEL